MNEDIMTRRKTPQAAVALLVGCLMLCGSSVTGVSCPAEWHFMESVSKCYFFSSEETDQTIAKARCEQREATLATIENEEVNDFINNKKVGSRDYWIGLVTEDRQNGNAWFWLDGSSSLFRKWASNEPTGDSNCSRITASGEWKDIKCKDDFYFICQKDAQQESASTTERTTSTTPRSTTITTTTTAPTTTTLKSSITTRPESISSTSTERPQTTTRSSKSPASPTTTTIQPSHSPAPSRAPPDGQRTTEPSKGDLSATTSADDVTQAGHHGNDPTRKALVAVLVVLVVLVLLGILVIVFELVWLYRNGDPKVEGYGRRLLQSVRARRGAFRRRRGEMKTLPEPSLCD